MQKYVNVNTRVIFIILLFLCVVISKHSREVSRQGVSLVYSKVQQIPSIKVSGLNTILVSVSTFFGVKLEIRFRSKLKH